MSKKNKHFVVMWDCHGLEALQMLPDPAETTFALLQNKKPPEGPNIEHWKLRARYNTQRHYEIYIFSTEPGIELDDVLDMFKQNPQHAADTIRRIGHCYYSDRRDEEKIVIR